MRTVPRIMSNSCGDVVCYSYVLTLFNYYAISNKVKISEWRNFSADVEKCLARLGRKRAGFLIPISLALSISTPMEWK
jgi:hypothetical protein